MSLEVFEQKGSLEDTFPQHRRTGLMEGKKAEGMEKAKERSMKRTEKKIQHYKPNSKELFKAMGLAFHFCQCYEKL